MLRKHLPGNHLVVHLVIGCGVGPLVEFDRCRTVLIVNRTMLARDRTLAGLMLAGDDGRVGGKDERGQGPLRLFHFGRQASSCAALRADALLVLLPEPADKDEDPNGNDAST